MPSATSIQVLLGSSALLGCEAVGNPQPDISWKFNGRKLPKDGDDYDLLSFIGHCCYYYCKEVTYFIIFFYLSVCRWEIVLAGIEYWMSLPLKSSC